MEEVRVTSPNSNVPDNLVDSERAAMRSSPSD